MRRGVGTSLHERKCEKVKQNFNMFHRSWSISDLKIGI